MRAGENVSEQDLGGIIVPCRHRRRASVFLDLGGSRAQVILMPLATAAFVTLCIFTLGKYVVQSPPEAVFPVAIFTFVATATALYLFLFTTSDEKSLVLHEYGFRYRRRIACFEDLVSIRSGKGASAFNHEYSGAARLLAPFLRAARLATVMKEVNDHVTITADFRDGEELVLKNAMFEYRQEDISTFFEYLRSHYPDLLEPAGPREEETPLYDGDALEDAQTEAALSTKTPGGIDPSCGDRAAGEARGALAAGHYRSTSYLLGVTRDAKMREFYVRALDEWEGRPAVFDRWKEEDSRNPNAWLMSGAQLIHWAWEARGGDKAATVKEKAWDTFFERLRMASADLDRAAQLNLTDPMPHALQLRICLGLSSPREETLQRFESAIRLCSDHYMAHAGMLTYLCKKWHGSHEEMFGFARAAAEQADEGGLLPALIAVAHVERWLYAAAFDEDESSNDYFLQPDVRDEIRQAYASSLGSPRHRSTPLSNVAANYFAYTLARCGEWDFARKECKRIGEFPAYFPWCYGGDPVDFYVRTRAALFETAGV